MEPMQPSTPTQFGAMQPPAAPVTPAAHHSVSSAPYESNPFKVSITGLITILKTNPMTSILLGLVLGLLFFAVFIVIMIVSVIVPILGILLGIVAVVAIFPIVVGSFAALGVSSMKGESQKSMAIIKQASAKMLPVLGASLLVYLVVALGMILFIIPGLIFAAWFSFTFLVMFDENLGPVAAMKRSKELAKGHFFEIMGALFAGLLLSGSTSNGGGLLAQAITIGPIVGRYEQLKALKDSGAPKPKVHWLNYFLVLVLPILFGLLMLLLVIPAVVANNKATKDLNNANSSYTSPFDTSSSSPY